MVSDGGWDAAAAESFCSQWLPAWTGNDPDRLLAFYSEDAFYSDPAVPRGVEGREALRRYFTKLLGRYPDWRWTHRRSLPLPDGFLNYWQAHLSDDGDAPSWEGVCVVRLRGSRIFRNEVFFDRSAMPRGTTEVPG
ncbi:MAG TPA: nuclear transport factor 2 family protein [Allosphingosinicella sp.]|nr:nuclear transport factor 2 family protein [Allosphingosinicella sp.]